MNRLVRI